MRLCRFAEDRVGLVRGDAVFDVTAALVDLRYPYPLPRFDPLMADLALLRPAIERAADRAVGQPVTSIGFLSPVANPGKIIAAPVNYKKHLEEARADAAIHHRKQIEEIQRVGLFLKATSSVVGPSEGVAIRHAERRTDHEIELAAVIGRPADRVSARNALDCVAGYCIGLDITVRGPEERSLRKSIDSYTVLGPWLVTSDELPDPSNLDLSLAVNGESRQSANTGDLIIGVAELIAYASSFYTLMPGDVLLTGTPEGVAPIQAGDVMRAAIAQVGAMDVKVRGADSV